jgi:outer membrane autotransporter protein
MVAEKGVGDPTVQQVYEALQHITNNLPAGQSADLALKAIIGESLLDVSKAFTNTILKSQGVVLGRLDRIRELDCLIPPAAGFAAPSAGAIDSELNRLWIGGFGVWSKTDNDTYVLGSDYKSQGIAVGYDRLVDSVPGLRLGLSASFSSGTIDNNDDRTEINVDSIGVGVYGSYLHSSGVFVDATVAYSQAQNSYNISVPGNVVKQGDFDINAWQFGARVGYVYRVDKFQIVPTVGVRFINFDQKGWSENITAGQGQPLALANWFGKTKDHQIDVPIQVKFNGTFELGSATVIPEVRLGWTYAAKRATNGTNVGFVGSTQSAQLYGIKPDRSTFQVGAGVKIKTPGSVDIFINYDLDAASNFKAHQLTGGLGITF